MGINLGIILVHLVLPFTLPPALAPPAVASSSSLVAEADARESSTFTSPWHWVFAAQPAANPIAIKMQGRISGPSTAPAARYDTAVSGLVMRDVIAWTTEGRQERLRLRLEVKNKQRFRGVFAGKPASVAAAAELNSKLRVLDQEKKSDLRFRAQQCRRWADRSTHQLISCHWHWRGIVGGCNPSPPSPPRCMTA